MSAGIYFHPEAYTTSGPKLMGRNAAGESFIRGYMEHLTECETLYAQVESPKHGELFRKLAAEFGRPENIETFSRPTLYNAKRAGVIFHPGPAINGHAYDRTILGDSSWALCGITHTTSSAAAMDSLVDILTAPVQTWDAIICPSTSVKKNVENLLQAQINYLKDRLGITNFVVPLLPVVPLGIHTKDFRPTIQRTQSARNRLNIKADDIVVLYMGRLSFHAKANPLVLYQALESTHQITKKNIVLVECGWHSNDFIKDAYAQASARVCPSIRKIVIDGRVSENRTAAWASADIFCSLPDNIQETFGIVPLEAMASGLPVVVSDWNGYRDSVRDDLDGFRIPTTAPAPGTAQDIADRHALSIDSYDRYIGYSSSLVSIDVVKLTNAFCQLANSEELRKKMGSSGLKRANDLYDWKFIIKKYEDLWEEQRRILDAQHAANIKSRRNASGNQTVRRVRPARLDPSVSFSHYSTYHISENITLCRNYLNYEVAIKRLVSIKDLEIVKFAEPILPSEEILRSLIYSASLIEDANFIASSIMSDPSENKRDIEIRALSWLLKMGIFRLP